MKKSALVITLGAILLIAAVAGFIVVPEHTPGTAYFDPQNARAVCGPPGTWDQAAGCTSAHVGLSQAAYDAARIATRALLIVGALLVIVGLINYARRPRLMEGVR